MNRTRGFVNLNRFKSGKSIKKLIRIADDRQRVRLEGRKRKGKK